MITKTNRKIAFSHLTSRLKQTIVAILSVMFGVSMYVTMNAFMNGVNDIQTEMAFTNLAHVRIFNDLPEDNTNLLASSEKDAVINLRNARVIQYTEGIKNSQKLIDFIQKKSEVVAITPQVKVSVFFKNGATEVNGSLLGVDVENEDKLFEISQYVIEGNWSQLSYRNDGIILGKGLARKLSVKLNDNLTVNTSNGKSKNYKIIGIIETTMSGIDNARGYVRISSTRQLLAKNIGYITDLQINIQDFNQANDFAEEISQFISYEVESWQESNGQLEAGSELRDIIALSVSIAILIVAGFGIYNIMTMTVNEKIKEIAILKAMGFAGTDIMEIFLTQSIIIGFLGGFFGLGMGYLLSAIIDNIPFEVATITNLPIVYRPKDYALSFLFGLITTIIAGYLPSRKASKVDPVDIIRG